MESKTLHIDTGVASYTLNDAVTICFNPTDLVFIERLFSTFGDLDAKQNEIKADVEKLFAEINAGGDKRKLWDYMREKDAEMRTAIDSALGAPVCDALFGKLSMYAIANGLPVWANLLLGIIDEVDTTYVNEQKLTDSRIRKYSSKYHK
ncbi:MAG: hypothetical protein IKU30_02150 [Clostridia bacterium]|nr:hypothetical protein [Clostridia bacterium]MBR6447922.1 hypothetical protein [Methanomicrobium sp.]